MQRLEVSCAVRRMYMSLGAKGLSIVAVDTQQCLVFVLEVRVTVNGITTLSVAQQCFYDEFMSPATMKPTLVFM